MERARLAMLQKEYENGLRSGESLKKEAQRIVKENLAKMTTITTSCKTEAKDGREAFDVKQTLKQIILNQELVILKKENQQSKEQQED